MANASPDDWHRIYRQLNIEDVETRFLTISPLDHGKHDRIIDCELHTAPLFHAPEFAALSYTWGRDEHAVAEEIVVNEESVPVSPNLWSALLELCRRGETCVWIDAICINQADMEEKGTQVARMGEIYSRASKVVAWLGTASTCSTMAMRWLNIFIPRVEELLEQASQIAKLLRHDVVPISPYEPRSVDELPSVEATCDNISDMLHDSLDAVAAALDGLSDGWFERTSARRERYMHARSGGYLRLGSMPQDDQRIVDTVLLAEAKVARLMRVMDSPADDLKHAVEAVFARPFFSRLWILQEIAKGKSVQLWCGEDMALLDSLPHKIGIFGELKSLQVLLKFRHYETQSRQGSREPRMLLLEALMYARSLRATEPRDKIFALLDLARDGRNIVPFPNYVQDSRSLFIDIARRFIVDQGLTIIMLIAPRCQNSTSMPSWCPAAWDLHELPSYILSDVQRTIDERSQESIAKDFNFRSHGKEGLAIQGNIIAVIVDVGIDEPRDPSFHTVQGMSAHTIRDGVPRTDPSEPWTMSRRWLRAWDVVVLSCFYLVLDDDLQRLESIILDATDFHERYHSIFTGTLKEQCKNLAKTAWLDRTLEQWLAANLSPPKRGRPRPSLASSLLGLLRGNRKRTTSPETPETPGKHENPSAHDVQYFINTLTFCQENEMAFAYAFPESCGLLYNKARPGDVIADVVNCGIPFVLRPTYHDDTISYTVVGEAQGWYGSVMPANPPTIDLDTKR